MFQYSCDILGPFVDLDHSSCIFLPWPSHLPLFVGFSLEYMEDLMVTMRELSWSLILMSSLHQVQFMVLWSSLLNLLLLDVVLQWYQYNLFFAILFLSYGEYHSAQEELFGSVVPQHCNWVELLQCTSLEMVVPHYILVGLICFLGSGSPGQAFGVSLVE